jgi:hypothetical protein
MKRLVAIAAALVMVGAALALTVPAGAATNRAPVVHAPKLKAGAKIISVGQTWTMYWEYPVPAGGAITPATCEEFTFNSKTTWSGDRGSAGSWKAKGSTLSLTNATGSVWFTPSTFKLKYSTNLAQFLGYQILVDEGANIYYGPMALVQGSNPFNTSPC